MLNKLFKRMAPLVAGVILLAQTGTGLAAFPYIENISKGSTSATVYVAASGFPPGHTGPRKPDSNNYYWWVDQQPHSSGSTTSGNYSSATNVAVYVYPDDNSNDYSYAIVDDVDGTTIWNGP